MTVSEVAQVTDRTIGMIQNDLFFNRENMYYMLSCF